MRTDFPIHDRDSIFSKELDEAVTAIGVQVLRTPVRAPSANSFCELSFIKTPFVPVRGAVFGSWEYNRDLHGSATAIEPVR
jgi:hypothetical protein